MQLHPTNLPLERKLPLVLAGLLAVLLATSLAVTYRVLTVSAEAARDRLTSAAETVAESAQQSVEQRAENLRAVAARPAIHALLAAGASASAAQRDAARRELEALQPPGTSSVAIGLWSAAGELLVHAGSAAPADTRPPVAGETVVHTPMYAADGNVYAWTVAPVTGAGGRLGAVAAQMRVGGPAAAAEAVRGLTGEAVTMYLRNADGAFWAEHPGVPAAAPDRVREVRGTLRHVRPNVGRMLAVEARIAGTPWIVTLETPERLVLARANSTVRLLALVSLALLTIGTVLLWLFGRRFTRPLVSVTRAAEAIAAGDYGRRVASGGGDELGRLAASFNQMAAEIETSRRELIRRVHEAQEARLEAERLRAVADHARELAERASRARADFLAVMSHELRTPLNAIGGYAQLLELGVHGPVNEAQIGALKRIARNQEHLLTLINDVLNYAKLDVGKVQFTVTDVAVTEVFEALEPLIGPLVRTHDLRFVEAKPDPTITVRVDADKLQQILLNLLGNALKFTPAGGTITLGCSAVDTVVHIHVRDTGIGIAPERLEAIFDPFVQGDRALNRPVEGVGLGLAISRELARGMSGELVVQSTLGSGSVFTVMLPRGTPALRIAAATA